MNELTIADDLDVALEQAVAATAALAESLPRSRATWLRSVADALDAASEELVPIAARESHLTVPRLTGELVRTTFQLRLFADFVDDGDYLHATIDHADAQWPMGARPDLRRVLRPIGPAAVYAASNFPFAFSVAGGDTAAAIAAGCPVIVKAHPAHPDLSRAVARLVTRALDVAGAPRGTFSLVEGLETGRELITDPRLTVATFTGSLGGGRALFDLAAARPVPIPFYGELGSVNPVFVTEAAATARASEIATGFVASMTLGVGQFCTKPGILFVPDGSGLEGLVADAVGSAPTGPMLSDTIRDGFYAGLAPLAEAYDVELLAGEPTRGAIPSATLYGTDAATFVEHVDELLQEHFGPAALLVRYTTPEQLLLAATVLDGQLTATVHGEEADRSNGVDELLALLAAKAGRVLWNGWPTGVSVTYAQQHGGPFPATTSPQATSVGTASIERFLRPVAYQNLPDALLPPPLQEANPWHLRRTVDGVLTTPGD